MVTRKLQWETGLPDSESAIGFTIGSTVMPFLGVSGLALRPFRQKWAGWASDCSEWISRNSYQSAPHLASWQASCYHIHTDDTFFYFATYES